MTKQTEEADPIVDVYDLTGVDPNGSIEPGFYYDIRVGDPESGDEDAGANLAGPFATAIEARDAGVEFLRDAINGAPELQAAE